ncbi:MAG: CCA tRNA nucleotidyltransferase [Gemmatales bacterium]|nr:CCA tRNA nucleotidyltransferase [Gemmatales bacterium]MDW8386554.1 CCA tRNA nucleotidyltransferase [Gemmatales bacterium]
MTEAQFAYSVVHRLRDAGYQALFAGGCVRDMLLGLEPHDFDVATDARPEEVQRLFRRTLAVGASFGVIEVLGPRGEDGKPLRVQVSTFRAEGPYSDGRHPDRVTFTTAEGDASRRDFTINGLFYDPIAAQVIDYVGGRKDLDERVLRAIGNPWERFAEDKLRMLRAIRFAARFDLTIEPNTFQAIREMAQQITVVSAERIAEELRRMLTDSHRARAIQLMWDSGLVHAILPELVPFKEAPWGSTGNVWDHVVRVLDRLRDPSFPLAFAALLHHLDGEAANSICRRLKLSNDERERIVWLIENHDYLCNAPRMRISQLKTVFAHPGIRELLDLHRADAEADGRSTEHVAFCERLLEQWSEAEINPPPLLSGSDLIRMGLKPGPLFRTLLERVREAQLEGEVKNADEARQLVQRLLSSEGLSGEPKT